MQPWEERIYAVILSTYRVLRVALSGDAQAVCVHSGPRSQYEIGTKYEFKYFPFHLTHISNI